MNCLDLPTVDWADFVDWGGRVLVSDDHVDERVPDVSTFLSPAAWAVANVDVVADGQGSEGNGVMLKSLPAL